MMRSGSLWRQRDFRLLGIGQAISEMGSVVTRTALPIAAILVLDAGALEVGLLVAASSVGVLIVGLAAGAWVDRLPRRPVLIWTDLARAFLVATIPLAAVLGALRIELMYVVAFCSAALGSLFDAAYRSYPPVLVPRERLVEANSALAGVGAAAELTGPSLAGALVQLASAPFALLIDAVSFFVSAISLAFIRTQEARAVQLERREPLLREVGQGLAFLVREPSLRLIAAGGLLGALFGNFFAALYTLYALEELGLSPLVLGLIISAGGIGDLAASAFSAPIARRFGIGPAIVWCEIAAGLLGLLTALAGGPPLVAALFLFIPQLVGDGFATVALINSVTLRQVLAPAGMLGRVNATMHVVSRGIAPAGALVGAVIAEAAGIRVAVWIAVLGGLAGSLILLLPSPLLRTREVA